MTPDTIDFLASLGWSPAELARFAAGYTEALINAQHDRLVMRRSSRVDDRNVLILEYARSGYRHRIPTRRFNVTAPRFKTSVLAWYQSAVFAMQDIAALDAETEANHRRAVRIANDHCMASIGAPIHIVKAFAYVGHNSKGELTELSFRAHGVLTDWNEIFQNRDDRIAFMKRLSKFLTDEAAFSPLPPEIS